MVKIFCIYKQSHYYYTRIYNVHKLSDDTESEALAV